MNDGTARKIHKEKHKERRLPRRTVQKRKWNYGKPELKKRKKGLINIPLFQSFPHIVGDKRINERDDFLSSDVYCVEPRPARNRRDHR